MGWPGSASGLAYACASRRSVLEQVPFAQGYGVETGLLIDIARLAGVDRIAQVDLGVRIHRSRPLASLTAQAMEVLHAALRRSGHDPARLESILRRPGGEAIAVSVDEHPPLVDVAGYRPS